MVDIRTQPLLPPSPAVWRVKYHTEGLAQQMSALPGVTLVDPDTIFIDAGSYISGLNRIFGWPTD